MYKQFIPKELNALLEYISPAAFKVIDWKKSAKKYIFSPKSKVRTQAILTEIEAKKNLFHPDLEFSADSTDVAPLDQSLKSYEIILDLYFSQIYASDVMFLDLRSKFFLQNNKTIVYSPSNTIIEIEPDFRLGLIDLYEGFYFDQPKKLRKGLLQLGLIAPQGDDDTEDDGYEQVKDLLFSHFGHDKQSSVVFNLKEFTSSFHQLFMYLKTNGRQLPADFLFLGVSLTTLYTTLAQCKEGIDVRGVFMNVSKRTKVLNS